MKPSQWTLLRQELSKETKNTIQNASSLVVDLIVTKQNKTKQITFCIIDRCKWVRERNEVGLDGTNRHTNIISFII
jgi:hypothetical protein